MNENYEHCFVNLPSIILLCNFIKSNKYKYKELIKNKIIHIKLLLLQFKIENKKCEKQIIWNWKYYRQISMNLICMRWHSFEFGFYLNSARIYYRCFCFPFFFAFRMKQYWWKVNIPSFMKVYKKKLKYRKKNISKKSTWKINKCAKQYICTKIIQLLECRTLVIRIALIIYFILMYIIFHSFDLSNLNSKFSLCVFFFVFMLLFSATFRNCHNDYFLLLFSV